MSLSSIENDYKNQINANNSEHDAKLADYDNNYNSQLNEYNDLINQQQDYINKSKEQANKSQQANTDYSINLINQNKDQAAKDEDKEAKSSYVDYMRQTNDYGGTAENLASKGVLNQGYTESSKTQMYNTYQNRVSTAKETLAKANQEYDNQIQKALLENNAALAQNALNQMQQSYALALQGFQTRQDMYNNRNTYINNLDDTYYSRNQSLQSNIASIESTKASLKAASSSSSSGSSSGFSDSSSATSTSNNSSSSYSSGLNGGTKYTFLSTLNKRQLSSDSAYSAYTELLQDMSANGALTGTQLNSGLQQLINSGAITSADANKIVSKLGESAEN